MEIDKQTMDEKLQVMQAFIQILQKKVEEEKLETTRKDREKRNVPRVDYSDPEENTAGIAKESNNELPNEKENGWTQDQEKWQDPEQEGYVET